MKITDFLIFLGLIVILIWHSSQVWYDPKGFVVRMQRIRASLYKYSFGLLMPKLTKEFFDDNPELEVVLARVMFIIAYVLVILSVIAIFI